jgi:hypothetical protein
MCSYEYLGNAKREWITSVVRLAAHRTNGKAVATVAEHVIHNNATSRRNCDAVILRRVVHLMQKVLYKNLTWLNTTLFVTNI